MGGASPCGCPGYYIGTLVYGRGIPLRVPWPTTDLFWPYVNTYGVPLAGALVHHGPLLALR